MPDNITKNIIDPLESSIADDVGNMHEDEIESISSTFDKTLTDALRAFNSSAFDDDGFIKKMRDLEFGDKRDKEVMKNVLNSLRSDYANVETLNHSELLLRRDMENICTQMPEMRDVVNVIRDAIIECNVSTGEVSRSIVFENHENDEALQTQAKEIEKQYDLLTAVKNFIVPKVLKHGEMYVHVVPYAKLFAELETVHDSKYGKSKNMNSTMSFRESIPNDVISGFEKSKDLWSENNLKSLMESTSYGTKIDSADEYKIENDKKVTTKDTVVKEHISSILKNINVCKGSSILMEEMGPEAFKQFVLREYSEHKFNTAKDSPDKHFSEALSFNKINNGLFGGVDQDVVNLGSYQDVKGCYIKYLDGLRMIPIRMDRRVIGYFYVSTTMDLQTNQSQPNGMVDLSYQHYTQDRNLVENLSNMIIQSFDKKFLDKNIKLKDEIAEIIMAHKFSEGKLSFIYIPENEVVRITVNEDEEGKGHSVLEPTMFPARMYLLLTMYNMLYTLNNNTTRIHYLRSSGLNKDYAAQIQRKMRKFQSRRITIDDIYSYSGVLNKVGGIGEMVLPSGRNDFKALETDTIPAVDNPIQLEFLEQKRREAISGTGVPHLMMINAIDEADFAKTLEMANTRFVSTVSSYKIDINDGVTRLYQILFKFCASNMDVDDIQSFRFQFNTIKQQELVITAEMITNFNSLYDTVSSIFFKKSDLEDEKGNPTAKQMHLRRELAKEYLPQLDFDNLAEIVDRVNIDSNDDILQDRANAANISKEDLSDIVPEE